MLLPSIKKVRTLSGKRVLVRVDVNVPMNGKKGVESDEDWRIKAIVETISYLRSKHARVILLSHLGRPEGVDKKLSLARVAVYLRAHEKIPVSFVPDVVGQRATRAIAAMRPGDVVLLENVRFEKGEEKNDPVFAKKLAALGDIYVNDAFAVSHRAAASVVGVPALLPSYAGLLLIKEFEAVKRITVQPRKPFVVIVGGAKTETKLPVIERFLPIADAILIGGCVANTALYCRGYRVGKDAHESCNAHLKKVLQSKKIVFPCDVVVGRRDGTGARVVSITKDKKQLAAGDEAVYDVGPETVRRYAEYIAHARTIVWNGAMGVFETPVYAHSTYALARSIAARSKGKAFGVVGGGETVQALRRTGMGDDVDHVSTGGGALLEYLAGTSLPGIEALFKHT